MCKVSRHFLLLLFFSLSFEFYLPIFCNCLFVNVHQHYCSWMYGHRCLQSGCFFFAGNSTCNLTFWPELLSFAIRDCISVWYFALQRDCAHKSLDLSKVSENFRNIQDLWKQYIVSCNTISKNQNLKNYPLTWKHGNEAKNIFSKTQIDFEVPNSKQEKTDRR